MTEFALTAERRVELSELLDDETRFRAEYPKAAEYLDMAARLAGTSDPQADAAFDLRFLHYMTGGESASGNPYWDIVGPSVSVHEGRRRVDGGSSKGSGRLAFAQTILQAAYAYAVPSPETLQWMAGLCDGRTVLELGAGRGYWAYQLAEASLKVAAFDSEPPQSESNVSFPRSSGVRDAWYPVGNLAEYAGFGANGSDEVLFLCWPPGWGTPMASKALQDFMERGGDRLVFIGEPKGGKTGDDAFFDELAANWDLDSVDDQYVSWWNLGDVAQCWQRQT